MSEIRSMTDNLVERLRAEAAVFVGNALQAACGFDAEMDDVTGQLLERVLPGWRHAYEKRTSGIILAWVTEEDDAPCIPALGPTPAIALLIAALLALSQEQSK